jgi:hypothetical protein
MNDLITSFVSSELLLYVHKKRGYFQHSVTDDGYLAVTFGKFPVPTSAGLRAALIEVYRNFL